VVGLPLSLSGADSAQTTEARGFAALLERELEVPVELYDERFTTRLAQRSGGRSSEDSRAAAHLLEGWLAARVDRAGATAHVPDAHAEGEGVRGEEIHGAGEGDGRAHA